MEYPRIVNTATPSTRHKKRLIFCTYPCVYSSLVLKTLLADPQFEVAGIISSTRKLSKHYSSLRGDLEYIRTTGWFYAFYLFAITTLAHLIAPWSRLKSVRQLAVQNRIPFIQTKDINAPASVAFLLAQRPHVLLAAHFNQMIKTPVLELPDLQRVNIHPSLLPDYRGVDPVIYALLHHEDVSGFTIHTIDEAFDTGQVLYQQTIPIDKTWSLLEANKHLFLAAAFGVSDALANPQPINQQQESRYDSWPDAKTVKKFRRNGRKLFRWRELLNF